MLFAGRWLSRSIRLLLGAMTDGDVLTFNKYKHHILEAPQDIASALGDFRGLYRDCCVLVLGLEGFRADSGGLLECQARLEPRLD
eukprot:7353369-Pyramimonas_sp.AAC.1